MREYSMGDTYWPEIEVRCHDWRNFHWVMGIELDQAPAEEKPYDVVVDSGCQVKIENKWEFAKCCDDDCDESKARDHLKEVGLSLPLLMSWGKRREKGGDSNNTCSLIFKLNHHDGPAVKLTLWRHLNNQVVTVGFVSWGVNGLHNTPGGRERN